MCCGVQLGLVDGIVTEDSDVFLFGGRRVYRHLFDSKRNVEVGAVQRGHVCDDMCVCVWLTVVFSCIAPTTSPDSWGWTAAASSR